MPTVDRIHYDLGQANDENNDPRSVKVHYFVAGAASVQEAVGAVAAVAPAKEEGISFSGFDFDDLTAPGSYKITARYRRYPDGDDELGGHEISLDTGANTNTRTECLRAHPGHRGGPRAARERGPCLTGDLPVRSAESGGRKSRSGGGWAGDRTAGVATFSAVQPERLFRQVSASSLGVKS